MALVSPGRNKLGIHCKCHSFSRGSSWPRDGTWASYVSCIGKQILLWLSHQGPTYLANTSSVFWRDLPLFSSMPKTVLENYFIFPFHLFAAVALSLVCIYIYIYTHTHTHICMYVYWHGARIFLIIFPIVNFLRIESVTYSWHFLTPEGWSINIC